MLTRLISVLAVPGRQTDIVVTADATDKEKVQSTAPERGILFTLDRALNTLVIWSGSWPVFGLITASVLAWAFLGILYSDQTTWQVFISDYQALLTYFFDSLLMRQQLHEFDKDLAMYARIRSRTITHARLLRIVSDPSHIMPYTGHAEIPELPGETRMGRTLNRTANIVGHIIAVGLYWVGIVIWIAFGPSLDWSNTWQLYINSATSALMVFLFAFLALCREQDSRHSQACLVGIDTADRQLEDILREMTGDSTPNPAVTIVNPPTGILQRAINYYAVLITMLVGIGLLITVVILWLALGPYMQFGDSWWLFIGTYAGLIGMIDGFVMRNVDGQLSEREAVEFQQIMEVESVALAPSTEEQCTRERPSIASRVSGIVMRLTSHRYAVVAGLVTTAILIIAASCLDWSFTGQLICNVPPSIIESFFMLILITGNNERNARKLRWLTRIHSSRAAMLEQIKAIGGDKE